MPGTPIHNAIQSTINWQHSYFSFHEGLGVAGMALLVQYLRSFRSTTFALIFSHGKWAEHRVFELSYTKFLHFIHTSVYTHYSYTVMYFSHTELQMLKITTVRHLGINGTLQTHILENYVNGYVELSNYPNDRKASDSMGGGRKRRRKKKRKRIWLLIYIWNVPFSYCLLTTIAQQC